MLDVSEFINEMKRDSERIEVIEQLESSIVGYHLPDRVRFRNYGRLHKDGELKVKRNDKMVKRYVFVFDMAVFICKQSIQTPPQYDFKDSFKLVHYKLEMKEPDRDIKWNYSIKLINKHKEDDTYTMYAKTKCERDKWFAAMDDARDNVMPRELHYSTHDATMATFFKPTTCDVCSKLLKGLFHQGYMCDQCDQVMHKQCLIKGEECSGLIYGNTRKLDHKEWFVGEMERNSSEKVLQNCPKGTFLVRDRGRIKGGHALSIKMEDAVKHLRVFSDNQDGIDVNFYLSEARKFDTLVELVNWYRRNSLKESFATIDTVLMYSIDQVVNGNCS